MKYPRAIFVSLCGIGAACMADPAAAQSYPVRAIRIIVPFTPGGGLDLQARIIAQQLNERWGQPVIVDNRPGASTIVGTEFVAKAPADGYTLLMITTTFAINPSLYRKLPFDALRDFQPVLLTATTPLLLVVHPSVPAKSIRDIVTLAKARPGVLNYASAGSGTASHVGLELLKTLSGIDIVHIPYKGIPQAFTDLLAGQVALMGTTPLAAYPYVKAGRLRALATGGAKRAAAMPDIPTVAESGVPGYEASAWQGMVVAAGTPADVVARLNREILSILQTPQVREKLTADGAELSATTPEQFTNYIRSETAKWANVVKASGASLD